MRSSSVRRSANGEGAGSSGFDAIVVGARCAGASLAARLAGAGQRVLVVDHRPPPRNVISTHYLFPNTLARLAETGVLERITTRHEIALQPFGLRVNGIDVSGEFTPIGGFDRGTFIRRPALDTALLEAAVDAGAETRFEDKVVGLVGEGSDEDPVAGVRLESGEAIPAGRVYGADGRASTVARSVGLDGERPLAGGQAIVYAYWRGLPRFERAGIDARSDYFLYYGQAEDGIAILVAMVPPEQARGSANERETRYRRAIASFPEIVSPRALEDAEMVSELFVAPETMLRGFFRTPAGPGWALAGDACHFKHPATAQGISDAIEQAHFIADSVTGGDPELAGYEQWRDARAAEHYEFSFQNAHFAPPELTEPLYSQIAADPAIRQDFIDIFTRANRPYSDVITPERRERWYGRERSGTMSVAEQAQPEARGT